FREHAVVRADAGQTRTSAAAWGCQPDPGGRGAQAKDRSSGCGVDPEAVVGGAVPGNLGARPARARWAAVVVASLQTGGYEATGEEPVATSGHEPGLAAQAPVVDPGGQTAFAGVAAGRMDGATAGGWIAMA